jgi:hypothetical protein
MRPEDLKKTLCTTFCGGISVQVVSVQAFVRRCRAPIGGMRARLSSPVAPVSSLLGLSVKRSTDFPLSPVSSHMQAILACMCMLTATEESLTQKNRFAASQKVVSVQAFVRRCRAPIGGMRARHCDRGG